MSTSPANRPQEDWDTILLERAFLGGDSIVSAGYGIQFVLFVSCARFLWDRRHKGHGSIILLSYMSIMFSLATVFTAVQARTMQLAYIDNRDYPGGPWAWFLTYQNIPVNVIFYAVFFLMTFFADALVLWRCWIIWTSAGRLTAALVVAFPGIVLIASFVMGTLWTIQSSKAGQSPYTQLPIAFGASYFSMSIGVNLILTVAIALRLLHTRRIVLMHMPAEHAAHYISVLAIIVESAALYSVFAIPFLVTYALNHPTNQVFLAMASSAQQIAAYLIIYRVAQGRAWSRDTNPEPAAMTTIKFEPKPDTVISQSDSEMTATKRAQDA